METPRVSLKGYRLEALLKEVPVAFVNALRRILLAELPVVMLSSIQILENTTSMTHEMLKHRLEMLPINVKPEETGVIRDTKIQLKIGAETEPLEVTTDSFVVHGPRPDVLLKDRDLGTPLYFMRLAPGERIAIEASLAIAPTGMSHVCVSTFRNAIDPDVAAMDKEAYVSQAGDDPKARAEAARLFDVFHIQRSFHRNKDTKRPDWFDLTIESIGVLQAKDLLRRACEVLKSKVEDWAKSPLLREGEGWVRMETDGETYTLGQFVQEVMYLGGLAEVVSRDIGHPLTPLLVVRFKVKTVQPEAVVARCVADAGALIENVLRSV
jgi:DNA-directed RNA polymerase subunit L